ncbi:MAG TPA: 4a-hydroxytetrahydrobiopterin dehydratase [Ignavibacteria bacterium]|nr:4a-hydroxytetrahydrobiopterin dehydratase [Ignavibacteria bacterium]
MEKLTQDQIEKNLKELTGWESTGSSIKKKFKTDGFPQTMGLVTAIGAFCQQHDHHPDYMTMKYSEVEVSFSTHSAKGITQKDIDIAKDIEKLKF